jgi:ribose transport system substrate-binding protein
MTICKAVAAAGALAALLAFSPACHRDSRRVIGVVPMGRAHMFWQSIHAGAVAAARETGAEIEWNGPVTEVDTAGQIQIVDAMINKHLAAIAVAPIDTKALVAPVERAVAEGIPVIIFDSGLKSDKMTSYVATNNVQGGELAADRVAAILNGKGTVAIVASQPGAESGVNREIGFETRMRASYPGIQIVDKRMGGSDFAQSLKVTENILTAHPELDALFASNEAGSVGATQAVKQRRGATHARLVGFDWSPALLEDVRSGAIDSLVVQNPFRIGYEAVKAAVAKLDGKPVEKVRTLAPRLIRKEDLDLPDVREQLHPDLNKYLR